MAPRRKKQQQHIEEDEDVDHNLENEVDDAPPSIDPYAVLGLQKEASADDVKKAYRKMALRHHPDKALESEKAAANKKFQEIALAYAVLSDDRRRRRYDITGSTAETLEDDEDFDWLSFYREQFENVVNEESIKRIADEYKGSDAERRDLVDAYTRYKGNLNKIYEAIMLSDILEDDDRFRKIFDEEIEKGTIESLPAYERENTDAMREKAKAAERKRREQFDKQHGKDAADKAKAKQKSKKNGAGNMGELAALIQQRQKARAGNLFDSLEAKYAPTSRGKKRAGPMDDEPPEEAFKAMRERPSRKAKKKAPIVDDDEEDVSEDIESEEEDEESEEERPKKRQRGGVKKRGQGRAAKAKA